MKKLLLPVLIVVLSSCGGGGGGGGGSAGTGSGGSSSASDWVSGVFEAASEFKDFCENPRAGADYDDLAGSILDENNWLRSWTNNTYLWYDEVVDRDPSLYSTEDYFELLKTTAVTASGADKDQFHFTYPTDEWEQLSQSGVSSGYGFEYSFLSIRPYDIAIVYVEPGSPAAAAGIGRGDRILEIDGVNAVLPTSQNDVDILNAGLLPEGIGELHSFLIQDQGTTNERLVDLTSASITTTPVMVTGTIPTGSGNVGYLLFNDHIATAEQQLIDAINQLSADSITDLVLDLRYNGGGFLSIASELSYMIAGATVTNGQTFELSTFNDKHPVFNPVTGQEIVPVPFFDSALGFSADVGEALPTLDLSRVFILTTNNTASASEAIINGLRGIGIEVLLFGDTTSGKPYGFYPTDNCGTTYFSIQLQVENAAGFGDYADGFAPANLSSPGSVSVPGCAADDDLENELGDINEAILAKALEYRETGSCDSLVTVDPDPNTSQKPELPSSKIILNKSPWLENRDMSMPK